MGLSMAGLGDAMVNVAQSNRAMWHDEEMANLRSELETNKAKALADYQEKHTIAAEDRKNAPLNRANAAIKSAMGAEVPVKADEVTSLRGDESAARKGGGGLIGSYIGDPNRIVGDISKIKSDDDKIMAANALEQQLQDAKKSNEESVAGKTRKLTRDEALAVADRSLDGDLQAQGLIKSARADKYMKIGANDTLIDTTNNKVVYQNKQGEENLKAMFENKLEIARAVAELKVQMRSSTGELPSDAKMVEYMVENGIAKTKSEAYGKIKEGKHVADSYSTTEETNPLTGEKITTTTRKGAGDPKTSGINVDTLFPAKK